jgi:choline dehydrogenase-like flavoprotein
MGNDPKTSVLNRWTQSHDIKNLFVTDGSFMVSSACQNPLITRMAFTARRQLRSRAEEKGVISNWFPAANCLSEDQK